MWEYNIFRMYEDLWPTQNINLLAPIKSGNCVLIELSIVCVVTSINGTNCIIHIVHCRKQLMWEYTHMQNIHTCIMVYKKATSAW